MCYVIGGLYMNLKFIEQYTKTYGKRFSRAQKNKFKQALVTDMESFGYQETSIEGKRMLVLKAEDYFFGNMKRMKHVIVVPYDTPERKFWPKVYYYPLNGTKTMNKSLIAGYTPLILMYVFILVVIYGGGALIPDPRVQTLLSFIMFAFVLLLLYMMIHGIGNKKNYNRYSSAVAAAVELASRLSKDERQQVAFLFTDKNKSNFFGAKIAEERFVKEGKNPNVIVLDTIGHGSVTQIGFNPQNRKFALEVAKEYPDQTLAIEAIKLDENMRLSTQMAYFRKAIVIASGEVDDQSQLYVLGSATGKDQIADEKHINKIVDMLESYIKKQK